MKTVDHSAFRIRTVAKGVRLAIQLGDEPEETWMVLDDRDQAWIAVNMLRDAVEQKFGPEAPK